MARIAKKVVCPSCRHGISRVLDSRGPDRLRECQSCRKRYGTTERVSRVFPRGTGRTSLKPHP